MTTKEDGSRDLATSILRASALDAETFALLAEQVADDLTAAGIAAPQTRFFAENRRRLARELTFTSIAEDAEISNEVNLLDVTADHADELAARIEAASSRLRMEFHAPLYVGSRAMTAVTEVLDILDGRTDGADE